MESVDSKITQFLEDLTAVQPEQARLVGQIRTLFSEVDDSLEEEIKYGGLVFLKSGSLIGGIFPYRNHISIEFSNGADFKDPAGYLEGKGARRRHLKIRKLEDIHTLSAASFIRQASQG